MRLRYGEFFSALAGRFDGGFSYEDADLVVLIVPTLAEREDAMAAARMLLSDYGHYCVKRKARRGEDSVFILDEFSAVTAAAPLVIDPAERVRDVGGQVVVSTQGYQGLGTTDDERERMVEALAGGFVLHACADPDELVKVAGTVRAVEQSWQLDSLGGSGMGSAKMHHKLRIDPDAVRQARVGEAWILANGHALHVLVRPPDIDPDQQRAAHDLIVAATAQASSVLAEPATPEPEPLRPRELLGQHHNASRFRNQRRSPQATTIPGGASSEAASAQISLSPRSGLVLLHRDSG